MACQDIGSGMYWNGTNYYSDSACTIPIGGSLDSLTPEEILSGIDLETPSKKEDADWLKWLKASAAGSDAGAGKKAGIGTMGIILIGGGVFILALVLMGAFKKK